MRSVHGSGPELRQALVGQTRCDSLQGICEDRARRTGSVVVVARRRDLAFEPSAGQERVLMLSADD
jgi:hypothetical protein